MARAWYAGLSLKSEKVKDLQEAYLGFLIVRPTFPFVIGRNVISPDAFKQKDFKISKTILII